MTTPPIIHQAKPNLLPTGPTQACPYPRRILLTPRTTAAILDTRTRAETDTWQRELLDDDRETR